MPAKRKLGGRAQASNRQAKKEVESDDEEDFDEQSLESSASDYEADSK